VWARRQGTAAPLSEIEAVQLFAKLGHSMVMVLAMGYGCHWGSRFPMTHREGTGRAPGFQTLPGTSPSALSGGPSYSSLRERQARPPESQQDERPACGKATVSATNMVTSAPPMEQRHKSLDNGGARH